MRQRLRHISAQFLGKVSSFGQIFQALFGGDGKAWRHRQANAGHFGKVGALAAGYRLILLPRIRMLSVTAECEDCLVHLYPGLPDPG